MKIRIRSHNERYTIQDDIGLWWQGHGWVSDEHCAIGLHGDSVLQAELRQYFEGAQVQYVDVVMISGQMSLFESEVD